MIKKVLLTGATGFIGSHVLDSLLQNYDEIHIPYLHRKGPNLPNVIWHLCNLLKHDETDNLIEAIRPTHLLHFAWYTTPGKYWNAPENLGWVQASLSMIESFVKYGGRRAVIAGSCAEYEWNDGIYSESFSSINPSTFYGLSKACLYKLLSSYAQLVNLSFAWGRIFFLYGPNEHFSRLVPSVVKGLLKNEDVKCSHGHQIRDFMHVQDVADAFTKLLASDIQGAINIASGHGVSIRDVVSMISSKIPSTGQLLFGEISTPKNDPKIFFGEVNRLKNELNWNPKYSLSEGLDHTIQWHQSHLAHS